MRSASRAACLAWSVVALAGCAAISGLDQIGENSCAPDCGAPASDDATAAAEGGADRGGVILDSSPPYDSQPSDATEEGGADSSERHDARSDGPSRADGPAGDDSTGDASDAPFDANASDASGAGDATDAAEEAPVDGPRDAANDAPGDAQAEAGCGPTNTVSNCGACGASCAPASTGSVAGASCNGTACMYTCQSGYLDCNASVAPNTDGCECQTPGSISATCCTSNRCPTGHITGFARGQTGLDQTFYDCESTLDEQVAMDACAAYAGDPSFCVSGYCTLPDGGAGDLMVCNGSPTSTETCVCWDYQGTAAGHAYASATFTCYCPLPTDVSYH